MHQGIDGDHACPSRHPPFAFRISPEEEVGQGHREDLGAEAVNGPERLKEGLAHVSHPRSRAGHIGFSQALIDPGHKVTRALPTGTG